MFDGCARVEFVCEECLVSGMLADLDVRTNEGDMSALHEQLQEKIPELVEAEIEMLVKQRTAELEHRTPHLITWQDFFWPAHCGVYCCFIKEVGKVDLNELAPDGDGRAYLSAHLHGDLIDSTDTSSIWEEIRPDSLKDNSDAYAIGVYLFRCLICGAYTILWDSQ